MSDGLDTTTTKDRGATTEFFLSDREGAEELREAVLRGDFSQRVRSIFSVQLELSCRPPSAQGEWVSLAGSSRDNLERAKDYILSCFHPRCRVELVSSKDTGSSQLPMAYAVQQHTRYDGPTQPPSLGPLSSCSVSSPGAAGTASLYSRSGYPLSPSSYQSPSCATSSLEHQAYHHRHLVHVPPTACTSSYHPPNIEVVRSIEEPTPATSTMDSDEQLRNAILQLPPEKLKNIIYATLAGEKISLGRSSQQQQKFLQHSSGAAGVRAQYHGYDGGSVGVGSGGHRLLSRSPDQREKKIDYFVNRLNYPREKVESVLDQLGPDAANNDILERLVKVCRSSSAYAKPAPSLSGVYKEGHGKYPPAGSAGLNVRDSIVPPSQLSPPLPMPPSAVVPAVMTVVDPARLRHIVIDGSNVAMRHGNGNFFSCRGIQLSVDYFRKRGHDKITVFVPEWRKEASKPETPIAEQDVLYSLEREGVLKYTPSRRIRGKRVACYDDRFILDLAAHEDGVIVSNDQFRDLMDDKPEWREVIETRLLPFQFVEDYFMIPEDPMGKEGPTLDQMLAKNPKDLPGKHVKPSYNQTNKQICPYLEKCTFGRKCKFYHPERDQRNEPVATGTPQSCMSPIASRTPNTSRSTTPSPSPEKWVLSGRSNRSSGEDLRQLHSNNSSTDDLTHYQGSGSGGTMDIAELMQGSLIIHDGSQQGPPQAGYFQQRPVPPNSMNLNPPSAAAGVGVSGIHSAPVFTNTAELASSTPGAGGVDSQHLPHRYTFPMAVLPQPHHIKPSRTHILTEHHHLSSALPPTQGGGATVVGGAGGGAFTGHGHDIRSDPNVVYSLQPLHAAGAASTGYAPSLHHQGAASSQLPGMFMSRDGWHYAPIPTPSATSGVPPPPHDVHPHVPHSGSLMQAPAGFYPHSQGGQLPPQPPPPSGPPGYNSRAATNDPGHTLHSQSVGLSAVSVPSTRTSPYHHHHQSQSVPQPQDLIGHRHHSIDYGHPQDVSPHRRRSYSSEAVHKQPNGHLPQVTSSPALVAAAAAGGGGPYNYVDYHQSTAVPPGTCSASAVGGLSRPFHGHQSSAVFAQSTHHMPPSSLPPSAPTHYNHRLPAVSERSMHESKRVNWEVFQKMSALFPGFEEKIMTVMAEHPHVLDIDELVRLIQQ